VGFEGCLVPCVWNDGWRIGPPVANLDAAGVLKYAPGKGRCGVCIPGKDIFAAQ
jgi:hypothetical protein